jgi:hypothetical protein
VSGAGAAGGNPATCDLEALLRTLCATPGPASIEPLGEQRPSERATGSFRIEPTRFAAFRAIELRPWVEGRFGVAQPELAENAAWSLPELADLLGPLQEGPRTPGQGPQFQGFLDDAELPARAAVYVTLARDERESAVTDVRIRTEAR